MKKLKYILSVCLMVILSVCLVSCTNDDPYTPSKPKDPKNSTTVKTLESVTQILSDKLTGGEEPEENFNYFSSDKSGEYYYNTYVCAGLSALTEISKINNIKDDIVYSGKTLNLSDEEIQNLKFDPDYANKIEALYISNQTNGNETSLKIYILGARKSYSNNKYNSVLFAYNINFNSATKKLVFSFNIAKTNSNISDGYVGSLFELNYNSEFNIVECYKFTKQRHFSISSDNNNLSSEIVANINLFSQICYFVTSGTNETLESNIHDTEVQNSIIQTISNVDTAFSEIFDKISGKSDDNNSGESAEKSKQSGNELSLVDTRSIDKTPTLPDSLIYIINSNKIDDFIDKLNSVKEAY